MQRYLGSGLALVVLAASIVVIGTAATSPDAEVEAAVLAGKPVKDDTSKGNAHGRTKEEPSPSPSPSPEPAPEPDPIEVSANPFAGASFYVDPFSNARREADALRSSDPDRAALFDKIGDHAQADWFGDWYPTTDVRQRVADRTATIRGAGALPVFVVYAIPARDCGGYSSGGTGSPDAYRAWVSEFAAGLDGQPVAVVLEPDALAQMTTSCLGSQTAVDERAALLADAIQTLGTAGASVYLDAGHSNWLSASEAASRLQKAGVADARGFALNVSNYRTNTESVDYGRAVSSAIGDKPFVVDTSRNGLGPTEESQWCNPEGRALGDRPVANPTASVDAYFWIKRPGESDGECNGGPRAGAWWPEYAEGLASRAQW